MAPTKMEPTVMIPYPVLIAVLALTVLSGAAATAIAIVGDTRNNPAQRKLVERLSRIAVLGACAIFALLSGGGR